MATADQTNDQAQDTTLSGDDKGEQQSITAKDVGDVADVLGTAADSTKAPADDTVQEGTGQDASGEQAVEQTDAEKAAAAAQAEAAAQEQATKDAAAAQAITDAAAAQATADAAAAALKAAQTNSATTQVRKTVVVPNNSTQGARDATVKAVAAGVAAPASAVTAAGTVVTNSVDAVVTDDQLPEVQAALKIAKSQTVSAMYSIIEYCKKMHPGKPQTQKSAESAQLELNVALFTVLSAEDVNFKVVFRGLLAIVRRHKNDCFRSTARNRGLNTVSLGTIDNKSMRFLTKTVDLLVLTAGTNNIEQVKQHFDLKKYFEAVPNVRIGQNLTAYFSS